MEAVLESAPAEEVLSPAEARELLEGLRITLPTEISATELTGWAAARNTPLSLPLPAGAAAHNYYLAEVPANILAPEHRLTRLCLSLRFISHAGPAPVAYDLYPPDTAEFKRTDIGEIGLDISKALSFVAGKSVADCIGFSFKFPLKWTSQTVRIETSDRMSNPLEWWVAGESIRGSFTGYTIIQAPRNAGVSVEAQLACEVRKSGLASVFRKATFVSKARIYRIS